MKGVIMVLSGFHPYIGGAEGQARAVAAALRRRHIAVSVVTRRLPGVPAREVIDSMPVERLPAWGPGPVAAAVFVVSSFMHLLAHRDEYDVIHAHLASAHAVAAAAAGRLLGKRVVVKLGGGAGFGEIALSRGSLLGRLKLRALGRLRPTLAAPNPDILAELPGSPLEGLPAVVIPNGVDLHRFSAVPAEERAALRKTLGWQDGFALLSTSRLADDKGVADLLAEFLAVWAASAHGAARLYLAGTGPKEASLRQHARELKAPVSFLGPRHDTDVLYRAADAFLLPSRSEGMSNALLEAMACGLPVLATRVSGTTGILRDGENGLLYVPDDFDGLRAALARLMTEPGLAARLGAAARKTAEQYSLEKTVDMWLELYGNDK